MTDNKPIRVGLVPYLNVQPLVWAFFQPEFAAELEAERFRFDFARPRELASSIHRGEFVVATVPAFEFFLHPGYSLIPGSAIATRHSVGSVILFSNVPIEQLESIELDANSLTSVNLLRVTMAERGFAPAFSDYSGPPDAVLSQRTGRLFIGDPAIRERDRHSYQFDLGELWFELTGLPFVFAAWLVRPGNETIPMNEVFLRARELGQRHLERVARDVAPKFGFSPEFALRYFRENLVQDFDESQQRGFVEFGRLCAKHGLCTSPGKLRWHSA